MQIKCQRDRFIAFAVERFLFSNEFHSDFLYFYIDFILAFGIICGIIVVSSF